MSEITEVIYAKAEGYKVVVSNTYIPHKIVISLYEQRISESKPIFEYLNKIRPVNKWDELTEKEFESMVKIIFNPIAIKSAYHMISEVHRTKKAAQALK